LEVVNVLEFRLRNPDDARSIAHEIESQAGPGFSATTWMQEQRALFRALRLEKLVTAIFIGLITLVAGLNILVVLTMTVTDRAKDIAVLRSMGAKSGQLRGVFLWQGFAIGAIGTILGLATGYVFAWVAGSYQLIPLDPQVYAVPFVPFHPKLIDGLWISVLAMGISLLATVVPARAAARMLPVEILRFE
jgi:lipoprotein-releasing system permease protein